MKLRIPNVRLMFRVGDEPPEDGGCPIGGHFIMKTTRELFDKKNVILFGLPGAFTPTCSSEQLPGFEKMYDDFKKQGIDEIYCVSVNDSFVMNEWARALGIKNVKMIPDGNGEFTRLIGMLVDKSNLGFGMRSHRYAALVNDGVIKVLFEEPGKEDEYPADPYTISTPEIVYKFLTKELN